VIPKGIGQGLPHLQLDGKAKHPVYATGGNGTKCRAPCVSIIIDILLPLKGEDSYCSQAHRCT
jgi:hypothetical protein